MKKLSFILVFVLIFSFFNFSFVAMEALPTVYAAEQTEGAQGGNEQVEGGETTGGEGQEGSEENKEGNKSELNILGLKIDGVWFWLAFAVGTFTLGFYVVKVIRSYKKK